MPVMRTDFVQVMRALRTARAPTRVAPCPVSWILCRLSGQAERDAHAPTEGQRPRSVVGQPLDAADADGLERFPGLQYIPGRAGLLPIQAGDGLDLLTGSPGR